MGRNERVWMCLPLSIIVFVLVTSVATQDNTPVISSQGQKNGAKDTVNSQETELESHLQEEEEPQELNQAELGGAHNLVRKIYVKDATGTEQPQELNHGAKGSAHSLVQEQSYVEEGPQELNHEVLGSAHSLVQEQRFAEEEAKLVIHKCCPENEVFDHATKSCQKTYGVTFSVPIFTVDDYGIYMESNLTRDQVKLLTTPLDCEHYLLDAIPEEKREFDFRVLDSGHLWVPEYEQQYDLDHYCLENFMSDAREEGSPHTQGAMVCVLQTEVETYDPSKIPVRKCCMFNQVYDTVLGCTSRYNYTEEPWLVPFKSVDGGGDRVVMVDTREQPYVTTHELVPSFQSCIGELMGWEVHSFHVREDGGGLYVPLLNRLIPDNQYCIEDFYSNGTLALMAYVCVTESEREHLYRLETPGCQSDTCIPKCCHLGEILDATTSRCVPTDTYPFNPVFKYDNGSVFPVADPDYRFGFPKCEVQLTYGHEHVDLLADGTLRYVTNDTRECHSERVYRVHQGEYCVDQVYYDPNNVKQGAGFCFSDKWEHLGKLEKQKVNYLYSVFLGVSDMFILVSFVVYLTVPDQNKRGLNKNVKLAHSVLGRILLCFLFSLFFAYLFLIIIKLFSDPINLAYPSACIAIGVSMYVFFMATFFWLNVLCFELWWKCARQEYSSGRRWVWYQVYGWLCPLVFGSVSLIMEFTPSISSCYIKPNFGTYSCFFSYSVTHNNGAKWAYFFGPVAVLLFADLVFFLLTVRSLLVTVQQSHRGTVQKQARQRLRLCFKLFLVMGISWLAEIISFELGPSTVWYISDIFNCFQGFIIFLIFILKPKILEALRARICNCCGSPRQTKPSGRSVFSSVMLNSTVTDEFSLSQHHHYANTRLSYLQNQHQQQQQQPNDGKIFSHFPLASNASSSPINTRPQRTYVRPVSAVSSTSSSLASSPRTCSTYTTSSSSSSRSISISSSLKSALDSS